MMGNWKSKKLRKQGKRSFTKSNPAKLYVLLPPPGGWVGGRESDNGFPAKSWPFKVSL